ncbi:MAG: beta-ketoacyl-ACP synthase III [Perlucidibaca sp.]
MQRVVISGTGLHAPAQSISNEALVAAFNVHVREYNRRWADDIEAGRRPAKSGSSAEFIAKASGIRARRVVDREGLLDPARLMPRLRERADSELSLQAEMAMLAGRDAIAAAGLAAADIDAVLVAATSLQRAYPAIAIEVQAALGCGGYAYDMNVACSSATFALRAATDAVRTGSARRVLVICPEICSGFLDWGDRDCHFIFGDVAVALVVEAADDCRAERRFEVLGSRLQTRFSSNIRDNFGFLNRCEDADPLARDKLFYQEGRKVFKEVCPLVAEHLLAHLHASGLTPADVSRLWLHQANINMNDLITRKVLGADFRREQAPMVLDEYGNTAAAGSLLAFHLHSADLQAGDTGVLCSFGAGYSIGSVLVRRC